MILFELVKEILLLIVIVFAAFWVLVYAIALIVFLFIGIGKLLKIYDKWH